MKLSPHALSLRQLQYVVAVDEMRNFRRAGELCLVSQPSLSAQLAQLEEMIGVRIFERSRRKVLPTVAGEELIRRAREILINADDFVEAAKRFGDPLTGTLRIGVIPTISPYFLPEVVPAIHQAYQQLTVRWVEDKTPNLVRELNTGDLDAALLALEADLGPVEHAVIGRDPFVVATAGMRELAAPGEEVAMDTLGGEQLLLLDDGHCFRDQALQVCSEAGVDELGFRATSMSTLVQMVSSGGGVTLLPRLAVPTEAGRGQLRLYCVRDPAPYRTLVLVWRPGSPLGDALRELALTMADAFNAAAATQDGLLQP